MKFGAVRIETCSWRYWLFLLLLITACCSTESVFAKTKPVSPSNTFTSNSFDENAYTNVILVTVRRVTATPDGVKISNSIPNENAYKAFLVSYSKSACIDTSFTLSKALKHLQKGRSTVVYVHGFGRKFEHILGNAKRIADRYNVNVIAFDWPSQCFTLGSAMSNIRHTTPQFSELLNCLIKEKQNGVEALKNVTLLMHSLGNNYFIETLKSYPHTQLYMDTPLFSNIIFNSPAIKSKRHGFYIDCYTQSSQIYIIQNRKDKTLKIAEVFMLSPLLGLTLSADISCKATYLDFSGIVNSSHTYFLGNSPEEYFHPEVFNIYKQLLNGLKVTPESGISYSLTRKKDVYEVGKGGM